MNYQVTETEENHNTDLNVKDNQKEPVFCPVCLEKAGPLETAKWGNGYTGYLCPVCDVQFNMPMKAARSDWYEFSYNETGLRSSIYSKRGNIWEFSEFIKNKSLKKGRLLEIGCGEGTFLKAAKSSGYHAVGVDLNAEAVQKARKAGHKAFCIAAEELLERFHFETFDMICFYHVLEHLENPHEFVHSMNALLKEGGHLVLSVPNPDRIGLVFGREEWDRPPHHLTSWNRNSLESLLRANGFEITSVKNEPLRLMRELPGYLSGKVNLRLNRNIETVHSRTENSSTKHILGILYRNMSKCKHLFSQIAALISLPWFFFKYRDKKGRSLLVFAKKIATSQD